MGTAARQRAFSDLRCFRRKDLWGESSGGVPGAISSCRTRLGTLFRRLGSPSHSRAQFLRGRGSSARPQISHPKLRFVAYGFWRKPPCPGSSHAAERRAVHDHRRAARECNHLLKRRSIYGAPTKPRRRGHWNELSSNHTAARRRELATGRRRDESHVVPEPPRATFCQEQSRGAPHVLLSPPTKR